MKYSGKCEEIENQVQGNQAGTKALVLMVFT